MLTDLSVCGLTIRRVISPCVDIQRGSQKEMCVEQVVPFN